MADVLHTGAALCLVLLTVARLRMLRDSITSRSLWVALGVLGTCQFLQVGAVYRAVEQGLGRPGSAALLIHALTVVAAAAARELHNSLDPTRSPTAERRHVGWAVVALLVMVGGYLARPPAEVPEALARRSEYYDETWPTAVSWGAYLAYLSWSLAGMLAATRRCARQAQPGPLRTGLRLGAAGIAVGFGYVALKVAVVAAWLAGAGSAVARLDAPAEAAVLACCLLLIGTGSAFEMFCGWVAALRADLDGRRSLRRLRHLGQALADSAPGSRYNLPADRTHQRLILQVTAIRDAQRGLRPFRCPKAAGAARTAAVAAGHPPDVASAVAEAVALELAQRSRAAGRPPRASTVEPATGGRNLAEEVRCLERLAAAYRHPFVRLYIDRLPVDSRHTVARPLAG